MGAVEDKSLLASLSADEQKRQNVILELITTEKQYVNDLRTLIEVYINPIQEKKLLNKKQMTAIFANVDTIYEINNSLLQELEKRQARETIISRIGDLFVSQADKFKVYAAYCSSQDPRAKKVTKYKQKLPEFKAFCEQAFMLPRCRLLELDSFLIAPLQRVCKYPLLLKETLKNTPEGHEDYADLLLARAKVSEVVDRINERTRVVKHVMDLKAIQKKLVSNQGQPVSLVERDRYPVREGALQGLRYQSKGKEKDCKGAAYYAFLLNDLFLLCQPTKESAKKEKEKERGSHGHGHNAAQQQSPAGQVYVVKEQVELGKAAARRVLKSDEGSPISSPSTSHRKQAKEKLRELSPTSLTSLFSSSSSSPSNSASMHAVSSFDGLSPPLSPQAFVPNQFEVVLGASSSHHHNHVKIYRFQTPTKIDADLWLRDFDRARTEHALAVERQRQQDQIDADALAQAAASTPRNSSPPLSHTLVRSVITPSSPLATTSTSPTGLARSSSNLARSPRPSASSSSAVPTRHTHLSLTRASELGVDDDNDSDSDTSTDNTSAPFHPGSLSSSLSATRVASSPQLTSHRSSSSSPSSGESSSPAADATAPPPVPPPPPAPPKPTSTPRSFFQKHRRRRSNVNDGSSPLSSSPPTSPSSALSSLSSSAPIACSGSPPPSTAGSSSPALESEVRELKLKLQEAERKLRVAELRIADLAYDNSELKKRISLYEKATSSGNVVTSPRDSTTGATSGSGKGTKAAGGVKRFIPGRRNGH